MILDTDTIEMTWVAGRLEICTDYHGTFDVLAMPHASLRACETKKKVLSEYRSWLNSMYDIVFCYGCAIFWKCE